MPRKTEEELGVAEDENTEVIDNDPVADDEQKTRSSNGAALIVPEYDLDVAAILGRPHAGGAVVRPTPIDAAGSEETRVQPWWGEEVTHVGPPPGTAADDVEKTQISPPVLEEDTGESPAVDDVDDGVGQWDSATTEAAAAPELPMPEDTEPDLEPVAGADAPAGADRADGADTKPQPRIAKGKKEDPPWTDHQVALPARPFPVRLVASVGGGVALLVIVIVVAINVIPNGDATPTPVTTQVVEASATATMPVTEDATLTATAEMTATPIIVESATVAPTAKPTKTVVRATPKPTAKATVRRTPKATPTKAVIATPNATPIASATAAAGAPTPLNVKTQRQLMARVNKLNAGKHFDDAFRVCSSAPSVDAIGDYCRGTVYMMRYQTGESAAGYPACQAFQTYVEKDPAGAFVRLAKEGIKGLGSKVCP